MGEDVCDLFFVVRFVSLDLVSYVVYGFNFVCKITKSHSTEPSKVTCRVVCLCSCAGRDVCNTYSYGVRAVIQCLPAWFRFIQCLRRYRDTKRAFPHLVNAGKYSTSFFVVTFAALYSTHKGRHGLRLRLLHRPSFHLDFDLKESCCRNIHHHT